MCVMASEGLSSLIVLLRHVSVIETCATTCPDNQYCIHMSFFNSDICLCWSGYKFSDYGCTSEHCPTTHNSVLATVVVNNGYIIKCVRLQFCSS